MPRDPDLLTDLDRRQRVTTFEGDRYPFPVPERLVRRGRGGRARPRARCGRCTTSTATSSCTARPTATPRVMDAHCPHLGAHLAVGGRVEGECLRCPFHGWKFDGESGDVRRDPLRRREAHPAEGPRPRVPDARAQPHDLGLVPRRGRRAVLRGARGARVPRRRLVADRRARLRDPRVAAQDMAENNVDFSHFRFVHGSDGIPEDEFITDGTYKKTIGGGRQLRPRGLRPRPRRAAGARAT